MQPNLEFYFFYHDATSGQLPEAVIRSPRCNAVDLTKLDPDLLTFPVEPDLRNALSEYYGHLALQPKTEMIGVFPYSIFKKFTRSWALEVDYRTTFLPAITAEKLLAGDYNAHCMYYLEACEPTLLWDFLLRDEGLKPLVDHLSAAYPTHRESVLPMKGSFIVSTDHFRNYQSWLRREIIDVIKILDGKSTNLVNPYSGLKKPGNNSKLQMQRFLLGGIVERLAAWFFSRALNAQRAFRIGDRHIVESRQSLLEAASKTAGADCNLIVAFCNSSYARLLDNWLVAIEKVGDSLPVLVCALDEPLEESLRQEGVSVTYVPWDGNLSSLWSIRIETIQRLVAAGYTVTHSDVDAVWLKNPMPLMAALDADVISSQGTVYPISALREWGHVLCCGFMQFRPTEPTRSLLKEMLLQSRTETEFDDQKSLNELLLKRGISWSGGCDYKLNFGGEMFQCRHSTVLGNIPGREGQQIGVALLPHSCIQRLPNDIEIDAGIFVKHPYSPKNEGDAEAVLKANNSWLLLN